MSTEGSGVPPPFVTYWLPKVMVEAVHLTEDLDWDAIATWCDGEHGLQPTGESGEHEGQITIDGIDGTECAYEGDWIVRHADGFRVWEGGAAFQDAFSSAGDGVAIHVHQAPPGIPYLTGVGSGRWHAVGRGSLQYLRTGPADSAAFAECGELVRLAPKFGAYDRGSLPVSSWPCHACAWTVAAAAGLAAMKAEAERLCPSRDEERVLDGVMPWSLLATETCHAVIENAGANGARYGLDHGATIQTLAAVSAHAPVLLVGEACSEDACDHGGEPCPAKVACEACSLQEGGWPGEWEGQYRKECTVGAPCQVLLALAKSAGVE